ncbi:MAG: (Fe-S)-binding protein, partial [Chloroflexota bacterium]|nr:(Fe-S)-binding protein [Chloroflexota bacterium]
LAEFLDKQANGYEPPKLQRKALVQGHCHHKAIMRMNSEENILTKMGLDHEMPDFGCCGMGGSFGFERGEQYEASVKIGERELLPAIRNTPAETLVIADGFICREQISQRTDRHALHLAQVMQMALHEKSGDPPRAYPERDYLTRPANHRLPAALLLSSGLLLAGWLIGKSKTINKALEEHE